MSLLVLNSDFSLDFVGVRWLISSPCSSSPRVRRRARVCLRFVLDFAVVEGEIKVWGRKEDRERVRRSRFVLEFFGVYRLARVRRRATAVRCCWSSSFVREKVRNT
ncbi:hypothetical protein Dimus_032267 [Dionaea muscipula]